MIALALTCGFVVLSVGMFAAGWVACRAQTLKQSWIRGALDREYKRGVLSVKPAPTLEPPRYDDWGDSKA